MSRIWSEEASRAAVVPLDQLFAPGRSASGGGAEGGFRPLTLDASRGFVSRSPVGGLLPSEIDHAAEQDAALQAALEQAHADGFAAGLSAARAESAGKEAALHAELRAVIAALDTQRTLDKAALGPMLKDTVLGLVGQVVGEHVATDPKFINGLVSRALGGIREAHGPTRLLLHPDDLALLGSLPTGDHPNLAIVPEATLPRGTVRLEADGGAVEDGVRPRLVRLEQALRTSLAA
jgi:flagellar assembly protein FliH